MLVPVVVVAARRVGLPYLQKRIGLGTAVLVQHPAPDDDALAQGRAAGAGVGGQVVVAGLDGLVAVKRTRHLGKGLGQRLERFPGRPQDRGCVRFVQVRGVGLPVERVVGHGIGHDGASLLRGFAYSLVFHHV